MAAAVETRAAIIAKLHEEMAARVANEALYPEKFDKLEENQLIATHHILALDKKRDFVVENLALQITRVVERLEFSNRDKPILGTAPPSLHHFQQLLAYFISNSTLTWNCRSKA